MDKQAALQQIYADIESSAQSEVRLLASQATQLVRGYGDASSSVVFIGEAPGKKEDEAGVPFCGASGRMLDELLDSIQLERKDIFITNCVKYRPPNNRDPSTSEKEVFFPYLLREITTISPRLIVPLGRHSMSLFIPDGSISELHGRLQQTQYGAVLPLYHPAAAIYNRALRQTLFDDIATVSQHLSQEVEADL